MEDWFCNLYKRIVLRTLGNLMSIFLLKLFCPRKQKNRLFDSETLCIKWRLSNPAGLSKTQI